MKAIQGGDSYRHLLATIATDNMSIARCLEVAEQALMSAHGQLYDANKHDGGPIIDEVLDYLAMVYVELVEARMKYDQHQSSKPKLTVVKTVKE